MKRAFDLLCALLLLALTWPLLAIIALAVRLDGGPALFRQRRVGRNAEPFTIFKFRTMLVNADDFLDAAGTPTRSRITRVGRWLRKSSLDELPQLFNIVRGDMSLIGPRPVMLSWDEKFKGENRRRFDVRPGVTGLAQVHGRNTLRWSERARLDRRYVETLGPLIDLEILARTVLVVLRPTGVVLDRNAADVDDL